MIRCALGVDIGTSSSKGVLVTEDGRVAASAAIEHQVARPRPGWVEMDADLWWAEFAELTARLLAQIPDAEVTAVGVSGMGPCVLLADEDDRPVRAAILYGVDARATEQIAHLTRHLGAAQIVSSGGSSLTTQAAGPKIQWVRDEEPDAYARAVRLFMPASWLVRRLTGAYVLDHHSASQCTPLYDIEQHEWREDWWTRIAGGLERPRLVWPHEVVGTVTAEAATRTGLTAGTPVIAGTIDAWTEAISAGAARPGDLMLMYGTTMFLVATGTDALRTPSMWTTVGAFPGTMCLAGGLATSGALTDWWRGIAGVGYETLLGEAAQSPVGADGLLTLPYFAGERTPILDPDARGIVAGLTLAHTRGDLYRSALEATAFGVRHNVETMRAAGADIRRVVAVGGGTRGELWLQIVSDVTGLTQEVPQVTVGASYGAAFLAASATADDAPDISVWNPRAHTIHPNPVATEEYDSLFAQYLSLYATTKSIQHDLARRQRARTRD
ncbi:FGGY family carbohydrate kinase [Microbacterium sp. BWT-B31]|uniref:FGGY-family carbohydrate kinase n=1 Tax=Microbacterium sp. BWT-B31 TaxID=3232072 RepID=UPI0035277C50